VNFSLSHSDGGKLVDNPAPKRDPEDYIWLKKVFNNLETDADKMKKLIQVVQDATVDAKKLASLEELEFLVEDLDNANDFHKMGGPELCKSLLKSENASLRQYGASLTGVCCQNNPVEKKFFLEAGLFQALLSGFVTENVKEVRSKLLSAVSALVEEDLPLQNQFLDASGVQFLGGLIAHNDSNTKAKALFLLNKLALQNPRAVKDVVSLGLLELILMLVNVTHDDVRHRAMTLLLTLFKQSNRAVDTALKLGLAKYVTVTQEAAPNPDGSNDWESELLLHLRQVVGL